MVDRGPVLRVLGRAVSNFLTVGGRYRTCAWMQAPPGEQKLQPGNATLQWRLDHKRSISNPHPHRLAQELKPVAPQGLETQVTSPSCHFWEAAGWSEEIHAGEELLGPAPE